MKNEIINYLKELFPEAKCELNYKTTFQLLIAVILSAQCTDKRVNLITNELFLKYPTFKDLASAKLNEVENIIKTSGMYHQKAKNIILTSKQIEQLGFIPNSIEELTKLNGVGRKTASVVMCEAFKLPAFPVDTHVYRVSHRLNLTNKKLVNDVENDLKTYFDKNEWIDLHYRLVLFGRYYCKARNPECETCKLQKICEYYKNLNKEGK